MLIWVHELGHFSVAKLFKVRVDEFSIGFPPRLLSRTWGETRYSLGLILVGGYVKIFGENPGDPSIRSGQGVPDPRALTSKNRGIQALVMLAGIAFNLVFAWLVLSAGYMSGLPASAGESALGPITAPQVVISNVRPGSPADKAGIKPGDSIERVQTGAEMLDTNTLNTSQQADAVQAFITAHQDESLVIAVVRDKVEMTFLAKPAADIVPDRKVIGVEFGDVGILKLPPHLALVQGAIAFKDLTLGTAQGLGSFFGNLFTGNADFSQVSGPIGIAGVGSDAVKAGFGAAAIIAALISINLALINLLPVPGLDGGRLLIIIIEAVIRRPVSIAVTNALMLMGFAAIVLLMLVVSVHDIARLVG